MVIADMSMSLDGYIAKPDHDAGSLFDWFFAGDTDLESHDPALAFRTTETSAEVLRKARSSLGAIVGGRTYFDLAEGWGGNPPMGVPMFIVTHRPPPEDWPADNERVHFVNDGVEAAIAQARAVAGGKTVALATPTVTRAAFAAGLLDGLSVNLVPILLGDGIPWFEGMETQLENPEVIPSNRVTHLFYRVKQS
jgi:dihydrofolate reductase